MMLPVCALAQTNVNASMTLSQIQSAVNGTSSGGTVTFAAGTYSWSGTLNLKCGITYTGPVATPATAILSETAGNTSLTAMSGGCSTGITEEYLQFSGGGALYTDTNNYSYINFIHNQATSIPSAQTGCNNLCEAVYFDGNINNSVSNVTIEYNTFGDSNSCTTVINNGLENGGYCAGVLTHVGVLTNFVVKYNTFNHVEEGIHINYTNTYNPGTNGSTCNNCDIEFNYFPSIHRIATEVQVSVIGNPVIISNNVYGNPINPYYSTLTISAACCQYGTVFGTASTVNPALQVNDNVELNNLGSSHSSPFGIELWGEGSQANNNLIQGDFCNGVEWGYGASTWEILYNVIQGSVMAGGGTCPTSNITSGYIANEESQSNPPTQTGNITGSTPGSVTSRAPAISPTPSGTYSSPINVTLSISVNTSAIPSGLNTVIYYTTDGSTPTTSSTACNVPPASSCTISVSPGTTVKALSMWGVAPQPTSYPSGYGYVPSAVVSATYTSGGGAVVLGNSTDNSAGGTYPNYFNDVYAVTGVNAAGYTVNTGTVCIAPGTVTNGKNIDIGINSAPTATTEGTTALCHATYTNTSSTSPGCVTIPLNGCGLLSSDKPYWLWTITNDPLGPSPLYFSNCGGTCNGAAPTSPGVGTYGGFYLLGTYGSYAAMSSTFNGQNTVQPSVYLGVTAAVEYGVTTTSVNDATSANYFNDVYAVTGSSSGGYTVNAGTVCIAPGTVTQGKQTDIGINTAPTATTEGATALCHATYTNTSSTSPGCVTVPLSGCGTLSPNTPYWLWTITNDPIQGSPLYFSNCGGTCNGSAPTSAGVGTYGGFYLHGTYGTYTGMSSAFTGGPSPAQPSVSLSVTPH